MKLKRYLLMITMVLSLFATIGCSSWFAIPFQSLSFGGSGSDMFHDAIRDSHGDYIAVGETDSGDYGIVDQSGEEMDCDALIVKYDSDGVMVWQKTIGDMYYEVFYSVIEDSDGNYLAVGIVNNPMYVDSFMHGLMIKLDIDGNILWSHSTEDVRYERYQSVIENSSHNYVVAGQVYSEETKRTEAGIWMYDTSGTMIWRTIEDSHSDYSSRFDSVIENEDGNFVAVGYTYEIDGSFALSTQALMAIFDSEGNRISVYTYGGGEDDRFYSISQDKDGNYIAVGFYNGNGLELFVSFLANADAWIIKIDPEGNVIWDDVFGGSQADFLQSVQVDSDGNYVAVGLTASTDYDDTDRFHEPETPSILITDGLLVKFDEDGDLIWDQLVGGVGGDLFEKLIIDKHGNYIIAGYSTSEDGDLTSNHGRFDTWIWTKNSSDIE